MNSTPPQTARTEGAALLPACGPVMQQLCDIAQRTACQQINAFAARLAQALLDLSETSQDPKTSNRSFLAGNLLKSNPYVFYHVSGEVLTSVLGKECEAAARPFSSHRDEATKELSLVPLDEVEDQVILATLARVHENEHAGLLASINMRLARLLKRHELLTAHNPFRPAVFIAAMHEAWRQFDPNKETHSLVLPLLKSDIFLDLGPVLKEINGLLIRHGIAPASSEDLRIKKTISSVKPPVRQAMDEVELSRQLERYFSKVIAPAPGDDGWPADQDLMPAAIVAQRAHAAPGAGDNARLFRFLSGIQNRMHSRQASVPAPNAAFLTAIKRHAPPGTLSHAEESTIDLLSNVFDSVFQDQVIHQDVKQLIGFLQMPLLKVALMDQNFFFKQDHPARRLVDLLGKLSLECSQDKGENDPLFQALKRNVERVQKEFDREMAVFSEVVSDLEQRASQMEQETVRQLDAPISKALRQEKIGQATKAARQEVQARINTGEVVEFVENFLVARWVPVLTIAYSMREEKPETLDSAIKTMDDLIWSVKPKPTMAQRKELIGKLPSMLAMINKWLDVMKWEDEERLRFFAELAECHASIVRAPLELSPQRQLEIATEEARLAAERRRKKLAAVAPEPEPDEFAHTVDSLRSGMWLEFLQGDARVKTVKLAWVSPLRTLFIFSDGDRKESFSMPGDVLAQHFRDNKVRVLPVEGMVNRALSHAIQKAATKDAQPEPVAAA